MMLIHPEVLYLPSDRSAPQVPQNHTRAYLIVHAEQIKLLTEPSMITFLDFLQKLKIFIELILFKKAVP